MLVERRGLHTGVSFIDIMSRIRTHAQRRRRCAVAVLEDDHKTVRTHVQASQRQKGKRIESTIQTLKDMPLKKQAAAPEKVDKRTYTEAPQTKTVIMAEGRDREVGVMNEGKGGSSGRPVRTDGQLIRTDSTTSNTIVIEAGWEEVSLDPTLSQLNLRYSRSRPRTPPLRQYIRLNDIGEALRSAKKDAIADSAALPPGQGGVSNTYKGSSMRYNTACTYGSGQSTDNGRSSRKVELQYEAQGRLPPNSHTLELHSQTHTGTHKPKSIEISTSGMEGEQPRRWRSGPRAQSQGKPQIITSPSLRTYGEVKVEGHVPGRLSPTSTRASALPDRHIQVTSKEQPHPVVNQPKPHDGCQLVSRQQTQLKEQSNRQSTPGTWTQFNKATPTQFKQPTSRQTDTPPKLSRKERLRLRGIQRTQQYTEKLERERLAECALLGVSRNATATHRIHEMKPNASTELSVRNECASNLSGVGGQGGPGGELNQFVRSKELTVTSLAPILNTPTNKDSIRKFVRETHSSLHSISIDMSPEAIIQTGVQTQYTFTPQTKPQQTLKPLTQTEVEAIFQVKHQPNISAKVEAFGEDSSPIRPQTRSHVQPQLTLQTSTKTSVQAQTPTLSQHRLSAPSYKPTQNAVNTCEVQKMTGTDARRSIGEEVQKVLNAESRRKSRTESQAKLRAEPNDGTAQTKAQFGQQTNIRQQALYSKEGMHHVRPGQGLSKNVGGEVGFDTVISAPETIGATRVSVRTPESAKPKPDNPHQNRRETLVTECSGNNGGVITVRQSKLTADLQRAQESLPIHTGQQQSVAHRVRLNVHQPTHTNAATHLQKHKQIRVPSKKDNTVNEEDLEIQKWKEVFNLVTHPKTRHPQHIYDLLPLVDGILDTRGDPVAAHTRPLRIIQPPIEGTHAIMACGWRLAQMAESGLDPGYKSREFSRIRDILMSHHVRLESVPGIKYAGEASLLWRRAIERYPRGPYSINLVESMVKRLTSKVKVGVGLLVDVDAQYGKQALSLQQWQVPASTHTASHLGHLVDTIATLPRLLHLGRGAMDAVFVYARPRLPDLDNQGLVTVAHACASSLDVLQTHLDPGTLGVRAQFMGDILKCATANVGTFTDKQLHAMMSATACMAEPLLVQLKSAQLRTQSTGDRNTRLPRNMPVGYAPKVAKHDVDMRGLYSVFSLWCTVAQKQLADKGHLMLNDYKKDSTRTMELLEEYMATVSLSMRVQRTVHEAELGSSVEQRGSIGSRDSTQESTQARAMLMHVVHKLSARSMAESDSYLLASIAEVYRFQDKILTGMSDEDCRHFRFVAGFTKRDESVLSMIVHKLYSQPGTWWEEMSVLRKVKDTPKRLLRHRKQLFGTPYDAKRTPVLPLGVGERLSKVFESTDNHATVSLLENTATRERVSSVAIYESEGDAEDMVQDKDGEESERLTYTRAYHNYRRKVQQTFASPHASLPLSQYSAEQRDYLKLRLDRTELYAGDGTRLLSSPHPNDLRTIISVLGDAAHELPFNSAHVDDVFTGLSHMAAYRMPDFSPTQVVDVMEAFTKLCVNRWQKHSDMCARVEPFFITAIAHICAMPNHYTGQNLHKLLAACTHLGIANEDLYGRLAQSILASRNSLSGEDMTNVVVSYANAGFPMGEQPLKCAINLLERNLRNLSGESLFRVALAMTMFSEHANRRMALLRAIASRFAAAHTEDKSRSDPAIEPGDLNADARRISSRLHPSTQIILASIRLGDGTSHEEASKNHAEREIGSLHTVQPASKLVSLVELMVAEGVTTERFYKAIDACVASRLHEFEPDEVQRIVYAASDAGVSTPGIIHAMEVEAGNF
ncbi:hypothetical protein SARC_08812 [Sphaeroforma arctica JP610]|uniref:Uncharacterized protein n=1 Tax=Sphaeroforma arctica JP610 TaxID=667725 RepID=A0A0L0FQE9_9EUKA|nr:hypothetical protein SARC_08812 [Sphaeroforma arctica JP610]KNC78771.1 hypothetical protein SARC_08812 [Sphaeroforma arctica JP610]|eukprot:XP_014152673.1 hypothetical protein SARC_08812 [Sphaeroforma arctica JP610]